MVLRMAKGEHVRTFWPLMLQCGSEDGDNYSAGFEKLHAELIEWGIPSPSQVHLDSFSSSKKAAQRVWPRAVVCRSIQHLRRNLLRNHRKGRRPPHPRKKKTKDHADSRRNRRKCSQPRLGEKKPKLAPHLKERSIFAFFDLFNRLMLVPSLSMHHLLLEIVLRRISNVWGDTSWVQYFEEQYCSKKRVDAELYGVDQAGCCCCCCHFFLHSRIVIEGSLQVKLPTIWTDGKAQPGRSSEREKVRREKIREGESQKKEDPGARKGRRVAKHSVFQLFVFPEGRKVGSLTRWVQRQLAREEMKTCIRCGAKHISKYTVLKTVGFGLLLDVVMSKPCAPLWREAHCQVKMYKAHKVRQIDR